MITNQVIETLYKKYRKLPESPDCLDIPLLFDSTAGFHNVSIDMESDVDSLIINSIDVASPFHRIALDKIHAIVPFEEWIAVVLHSSIIFLNRKSPKVSIHIRVQKPTLSDRIRSLFDKKQ